VRDGYPGLRGHGLELPFIRLAFRRNLRAGLPNIIVLSSSTAILLSSIFGRGALFNRAHEFVPS
jgi:hypothetical protein